ncbi:MAG: response regulator [Ginsengibacter sp.]
MEKRILIFDDDEDILILCRYILEDMGWEVHTRTTCVGVEAVVGEVKPDVILMDNWIPETGGIVATRALKANSKFKNIPVIYFSANQDIESLCKQAKADTFIAKPFDVKEFEDLVNAYVA